MRVNIYSQELSDDVSLVWKGVYPAIQFALRSDDFLHEDDKSAVSFWLPKSIKRREALAQTFENAAKLVRSTPPEI